MAQDARAEQTRWVPISALPVDLQLEVKQARYPARRLDRWSARRLPAWMMALGAIALGVALLHVLTVDDVAGFGSTLRAVGLFGGAALLALYLGGPRTLGFRAANGEQIVLGPASLVVVDTKSVRVIPAEAITFRRSDVLCGAEVIYDFDLDAGPADWPERLRALVARAGEDEAARAEDRYREAARRARPMPPRAVWWARRGTQITALGFALGVAGFLEAGPIDRRGARNHAQQLRLADLLTSAAAANVQRGRAVAAVSDAVTETNARKLRERYLQAALSGDDADARTFLEHYPGADEARPRVLARLLAVCEGKHPDKRFEPPRSRFLRAAGRGVCQTSRVTLYFATKGDADPGDRAARAFLKSAAADIAAMSSSPEPLLDVVDPTSTGGRCAPEVCPHVRLTMRLVGSVVAADYYSREESWTIDAVPIGGDGKPVRNLTFHHQMSITRPR